MVRDNGLNPKFVYRSPVHFDELDPMMMLHNARFAAHVERAVAEWFYTSGRKFDMVLQNNPDQFHVVRDFHIEYINPVVGPGAMRIDIWVERLGNTSCVFGFLCSSEDGMTPYARGERTIVKIDPVSKRPEPWTEFFRAHQSTLLKDLPAFA